MQTLGDVFSEPREGGREEQAPWKNGHQWGSLDGTEALVGKQTVLVESKPGHFLTDPGGKAAHFALNQQDTGLGRKVLKCLSAVWWGGGDGAWSRGPPPPHSPPIPFGEGLGL